MPRMRHRVTGAEVDMTDREARAYMRSGWQPVDEAEGPVLPSHAEIVLAGVDGDADKALVAYETEAALPEPDAELLDALERIINATPED